CPAVSQSRPARQCINVDFPDPDGPMITLKRPRSKSTLRSSRAVTVVSPVPKTLVARTARAAMVAGAVGGEVAVTGRLQGGWRGRRSVLHGRLMVRRPGAVGLGGA